MPAFGWTPRPEVKRLNLGIRAVPGRGRFLNTKKHSRWKQNPTQLGERRWRRRGTATGTDLPVAEQPLPLLLRSRRRRGHRHCLPRINRHSPAEASIDPRGEDTGHTPQEEGRREGEMEEEVGRPDGQSMRGCERREEAIYTGANTSSQIYRAPAYFIIFFRV